MFGSTHGARIGGDGRRRWAEKLAGLGALSVVLVLVGAPLASAGVGANLRLAGATANNTYYSVVNGCSTLSKALSTLDPHSGGGKFAVSTKASSCPRSSHLNGSEALVLGVLGDLIPVRMHSTSAGVRLNFSVHAHFTDLATIRGSTMNCPILYQNQSSYNGTTWFNQSYASASCEVLANVYVTAYAYLLDESTGLYYYPVTYGTTSWSNESGYSASYTGFSWTYSNPAYWSQNFSYPGSWTNYSLGAGGSTNVSASTTLYLNGSFAGSDRYVLGFYVTNQVFSEQAFFQGSARADLDAAHHGGHEDITAVTVY
ncbi:MAG TPA: hypothetical protein VMH90_00025 [Thermoplasmata archaeon]|nr:hypothetical protein [Thermoplasmata archaeon]